MKKFSKVIFLMLFLSVMLSVNVFAVPEIEAAGALLMEASTGKVLFEQNADEALPPASVTKVMTMLLVMEAIDSGKINLTDTVQASENAASMGGSQIYLKVGEIMTVEDLLKSVVVASANDAAVALAEYTAGSEEAFVEKMNKRAGELGMVNTKFENTNGLDDTTTSHLTSARDIAIMSRELLKHPKILEYSSIWMDTIRDGAFGLTNTNRLIRFYSGANGLKTGSTSKAKFCISATAKRGNMQLIAVIMGAPTRDVRNENAKKMFDWGFASYSYVIYESGTLGNISVIGGVKPECGMIYEGFETILEKGRENSIEKKINLPEQMPAPLKLGEKIGTIEYYLDGEKIGEAAVMPSESVEKIDFLGLLSKLIKKFLLI